MGHYSNHSDSMFDQVRYAHKSTEELKTAFAAKITEVNARIVERRERVVKLREDHELSAERLAHLISLFQRDQDSYLTNYSRQGQQEGEAIIPAGVIANIVREYDMIDNEQEQVHRMELVSRNIRDKEPFFNPRTGEHGVRPCIHKLDDEDLEYLGF
jgi:septal ring factor EnvC (AmiA/AmiB activator)